MVHGFLGSARDWALVIKSLREKKIEVEVLYPDLFMPGPLSAAHSYDQWTQNLLTAVSQRFADEPVHLLGYSLGGRLALHAAVAAPERWRSVWLLATNPGVLRISPEERRQWETGWARKFMELPLGEVLNEWNRQEVFDQSTPRIFSGEGVLDPRLIAKSLVNWSLTGHKFELQDLNRLPGPLEWWFGEFDKKFLDVKQELERQNIKGRYRVIKGAGHRLPLDRPDELAQALIEQMGETL
jgi:2-succinyl-6-hydroxy-2,4-cyclohexadiene-1-carboxylate synthase